MDYIRINFLESKIGWETKKEKKKRNNSLQLALTNKKSAINKFIKFTHSAQLTAMGFLEASGQYQVRNFQQNNINSLNLTLDKFYLDHQVAKMNTLS